MNPFGIDGHWKIDPDNRQDRRNSKEVTYKLSPEEIDELIKNTSVPVMQKRQPFSESVSEIKKNKMEADEFMSKITIEQLVEECKKLGFTNDAYLSIAKRYGFTNSHGVACLVSKQKIKKLVASEQKQEDVEVKAVDPTPESDNVKSIDAVYGNTTPSIDSELDVLNKIKAIVEENRKLKSDISQLKAALKVSLEEILKSIA